MKALVLEDDVIQSMHFKRSTEGINCDFVYASSVNEAKDLMEQFCFDINFIDLSLPGEDGFDFLKHLAKHNRDSAVVFVSGASNDIHRSSRIIAEQLGLGKIKSIKKPVSKQHIDANVQWLSSLQCKSSTQNKSNLKIANFNGIDLEKSLIPYYQPICSSATNRIEKIEVLSRIHHDELGLLMPITFLHCLEDDSQRSLFSETIIRKSLLDYSSLVKEFPVLEVSINFTHKDLVDKELVSYFVDHTAKLNLEPSRITVEVSEVCLDINFDDVLISICRLKMEGYKISMDDFGVGTSTLQNLINGVFDEVKIDKKFVMRSIYDDKYSVALKSMISFAQDLEMKLVCEGVENYGQMVEVAKYGEVLIQGFYFSKAIEFDDIKQLLVLSSMGGIGG